jgi:hypothetical protein
MRSFSWNLVRFHFAVNSVGELFALTLRAEATYILLWIIAAIGVAVLRKPEKLADHGARVSANWHDVLASTRRGDGAGAASG